MMNVKDILIENNISPSFHRLKIYQYLMDNPIHPTVDTIFSGIIHQIPTLSKTTVYNTLKLFVEKGLAQSISIEDNEVRYDATVDFHGHFKCVRCGDIYDLIIDEEELNIQKYVKGHRVLENHLYLKGICKNCVSN